MQFLTRENVMIRIYPSLISADLLNLEQEINALDPVVAGYHIDVMDNHFVPNLTWGLSFITAINQATALPLWVHLMVDNPAEWIPKLSLKPKSIVSFHIETEGDTKATINNIKENNWHPSLTISPKTPLERTFNFLPFVDQLLVMSVEPGYSGQQFLPATIDRVKQVLQYKKEHHLSFALALDGGINQQNMGQLYQLGITDFAVASAIFNHSDRLQAVRELERAAQ